MLAKSSKDWRYAQRIEVFESSAELIADLLGNVLTVSQHETSFKIKLPFFEISRKVT